MVRRVIVVVLDGLRPDAIDAFGMANLRALCAEGAYTLEAQTVSPSVTACAMTSLLTGAPPEIHGMRSDKFRIPVPRGPVHPLPRVLEQHGLRSAGFMARVPFAFRGIARRLAARLGVAESGFHGSGCRDVLAGARGAIVSRRANLVLMHWVDADNAGHKVGWMSRAYGDAARTMDDSLGELRRMIAAGGDDGTLLVALADHGGGGARARHHDSGHPLDRTIPIVFAGSAVLPGPLSGPVSLLDVPPTVLWSLGVPRPPSYAGSVIGDAFKRALEPA